MMDAHAKMISAQAKMADTQVKAQTAQIDTEANMAQIGASIIDAITRRQIAKTDAVNHAEDRNAKLKLEGMRLQQSQLVHRDKLTLQERLKDKDIMQTNQNKGLDLMHARRQMDLDKAHDAQQQAAKRLHEVAKANQQARLAERAQFMAPDKGSK
jgi:hypothetical protein